MSSDEAVAMLTARLPAQPSDRRPFRRLASRLGEWPLMLELARDVLLQRMARGADVQEALDYLEAAFERHGVTAFNRRDDDARSESYADILARAGLAEVDATGSGAADAAAQSQYAMHAHGAVFAEVKVDPELGEIRATRLVGAFAAGRIINPLMVQSQLYGGMIWGLSFALHEEAVMDHRSGHILNANLAEYHVPVNADVPPMDVITVDEHDPHVNALGIKGVGEIGITGSAGAVANAVFHATGIRVTQTPINPTQMARLLAARRAGR